MKRILVYIIAFFCVCSVINSCEKSPMLSITGPRSYVFAKEGGTQDFAFSCNRAWSVTSSESWCTVSPASGNATEGDITVTVSVDKNTTYDERECIVTLQADSMVEIVTISQEPKPGLLVSPKTIKVSDSAQTIEVDVAANIDYDVVVESSCSSWLSCNKTKSMPLNTILINVATNDTHDNRRGTIIFSQKEGPLKDSLVVNQQVAENIIEFDDVYFKKYCVDHFDKNRDGEISWREAVAVNWLNPANIDLVSVKGIEHFINLDTLSIHNTNIKTLDLNNNPKMKYLWVTNNSGGKLNSLNISKCGALQFLLCSNNLLETLDVSNCPELTTLNCADNPLTELNIENNKKLESITLGGCKISRLKINSNVLDKLMIYRTDIKSLDLSMCPLLTYLSCSETKLESLNVSNCKKIERLDCHYNNLSSLDVSDCTLLKNLDADDNVITKVNVENCSSLFHLNLERNNLQDLDVSSCSSLQRLFVTVNDLSELDVSNNMKLENLWCTGNPKLEKLWLKQGQSITYLYYDSSVTTLYYK